MPNHVSHRLSIKAPSAQAMNDFLSGIAGKQDDDDELSPLDFNRIIPMPKSVRDSESSSEVDIGLMLLGREDLLRKNMITGGEQSDAYLTYPWVIEAGVTTKEGLFKFLAERSPNAIEKGKNALAAYEETGFFSWYEWCCANWGTKWNAYSLELTRIDDTHAELTFDTAWSTPEPIFRKLAEMFPEISIVGYCFDEGWNFASQIVIDGGEASIEDVNHAGMKLAYEKVYGEPASEDDDEDDEEEDA